MFPRRCVTPDHFSKTTLFSFSRFTFPVQMNYLQALCKVKINNMNATFSQFSSHDALPLISQPGDSRIPMQPIRDLVVEWQESHSKIIRSRPILVVCAIHQCRWQRCILLYCNVELCNCNRPFRID